MPAISGAAPGKIILFGEHAVVYGQPAIAIPVSEVHARAVITPLVNAAPGTIRISAPDIGFDGLYSDLSEEQPLRVTLDQTFAALKIVRPLAMEIHISSTIPIASGLGSGAAIAVAMIRAVSGFIGKPLPDEQVSSIAFEVEKIYHGTPSGIDNAVVTYAHPMLFQKGEPIQPFDVQGSFLFLIADTGIKSNTRVVVEDLLGRCKTWPDKYHPLFEQIGSIVLQAYTALQNGENLQVGTLMDENHSLLQQLGVSSPELDNLVQAARSAGAAGAKLSGAGWGGNMISLVDPNQEGQITLALKHAGARHVLTTRLAGK